MLVDFGFARALEKDEIVQQAKKMRNSILFEQSGMQPRLSFAAKKIASATALAAAVVAESEDEKENGDTENGEEIDSVDMATIEEMAELAASKIKKEIVPTNALEDAIMGPGQEQRHRPSFVSVQPEELGELGTKNGSYRRASTARHKVRSMSALGTKAYAAPEIRKQLRHKTSEDFGKANAAMTDCVADYGMIVDAYSVGWTLRVAMTGVPPNFSLSEYMQQRENVVMLRGDEHKSTDEVDMCCCMAKEFKPMIKIRDPADIPYDATLLIAQMTEKRPEDRMTVREAQIQPWITGDEDEEQYVLPQGDVPSAHGDPVIPLDCAPDLSKLTVQYHMP
jgi:serine/threonine protein kinase